ncbi:nucleotide exchange factor GrpE [Actinomadura sp. DC4]|uniref:nucleotide exchange factor GrpE n=1 Tax=Actinomadura sp. DC4 TaxID=3055069 RepID=UPI0025AF8151|nr:nucleotide exchange factor GrpE [Actinomadura sp. DC4]MDN3358115.1 nucleotide exchange factor GrpE [Actinomadura sp. DC4]
MSDMRPGKGAPAPQEPRTRPDDLGGQPARPQAGEAREGPWPAQEGDRPGPAETDAATRISELEDRWRRALADLDNCRKRAARALEEERGAARAWTSAQSLPVLDNLERALEHAEAEPRVVIEGVVSVLEQARELIGRLGFPRQDDEGAVFDPFRHEAVSTVADADAAEGTVVRVLSPGYGEGERQLRPAQVVVAKGPGDGAGP